MRLTYAIMHVDNIVTYKTDYYQEEYEHADDCLHTLAIFHGKVA